MTATLTTFISIGCAVVGALISYLGFRAKQKKADEQSGVTHGTLLSDVKYIMQSVDEIKEDNKNFRREIREEIADLQKRVTTIEVMENMRK